MRTYALIVEVFRGAHIILSTRFGEVSTLGELDHLTDVVHLVLDALHELLEVRTDLLSGVCANSKAGEETWWTVESAGLLSQHLWRFHISVVGIPQVKLQVGGVWRSSRFLVLTRCGSGYRNSVSCQCIVQHAGRSCS